MVLKSKIPVKKSLDVYVVESGQPSVPVVESGQPSVPVVKTRCGILLCRGSKDDGGVEDHLPPEPPDPQLLELIDLLPWDETERRRFDVATVRDLVGSRPNAFRACYDIRIGQRRRMGYASFPLTRIVALGAPLDVVRLVHEANPVAIRERGLKFNFTLHAACSFNASEDVIQFIWEQYPEAAKASTKDGYTPLHCACEAPQIYQLMEPKPSKTTFGLNLRKLSVATLKVEGQSSSSKSPSTTTQDRTPAAAPRSDDFKDEKNKRDQKRHVVAAVDGSKNDDNDGNINNNDNNDVDKYPRSPSLAVIQFLVKANPSALLQRNRLGNTPLRSAERCRELIRPEIVDFLRTATQDMQKEESAETKMTVEPSSEYFPSKDYKFKTI